jgi:hypothetical protein
MTNITGRDGMLITQALAFAYAAMKHLPLVFQPQSNMEDMRTLLFARLGQEDAEFELGQAMLKAWNLRADVPPVGGGGYEEFNANLRRVREQVLQEPAGDPDVSLLVRHIDMFLTLRPPELPRGRGVG